jgi:hypothetical protein
MGWKNVDWIHMALNSNQNAAITSNILRTLRRVTELYE